MSTTQDLKEKLLEEFSEKFPETVCVKDNIPPTHIMEDGAILRQWFSSALSQMETATKAEMIKKIEELPTGMFDSTPYKKEILESLKYEK